MKKFKSRLTKKECLQITEMVQEFSDLYGEFYLTKNLQRLYIRENYELLFDSLKNGDKICYDKNCIVIITGFSDNYNRHYIKFLYKNISDIGNLLKIINWNIKVPLWCKIKQNNPLLEVLKANNFYYFKSRGKEVLLVRKYINKEK